MKIPTYVKLSEAADLLIKGKVGVIPTDTIYGIVVSAKKLDAVETIAKLKKRDIKPGTIIAANIDQLVELGMKRRYLTAVEQFWPGPVSVIIPTGSDLQYLHQGLQSLAVRIPDDAGLVKLLEKTGPLMTSSANITEQDVVSNIADAQKIFGDLVDFYVDGGSLIESKQSTIIQINDDAIEVIRVGAVKIDEETGRIIE